MERMIKTAGATLALVSAALAAPGALHAQPAAAIAAPDAGAAARLTLAREIVDLGLPPATREATFFKAIEQMTLQMREAMLGNIKSADPQAMAIVNRWLDQWVEDSKPVLRSHIPALIEGWATGYADIYAEKELTDIRAFVATPSGAVFFQRMQDIIGRPKFAEANKAYMAEVASRLPQAQERLRADLNAHFEKKSAN